MPETAAHEPRAGDMTDKSWWDHYYARAEPIDLETDDAELNFRDVFERHLVRDPERSVLEIGCANGRYLSYLHRRFDYEPHGLDFSDGIELTAQAFARAGLARPTLHKADLFEWDPGRKYDVVCSFGFVEHFEDLDRVIALHADLVAPRGTLIITMPHFAHAQYLLHWLLDRENLDRHNVESMYAERVRAAMEPLPFDIAECGYYQTFDFWVERDPTEMAAWERALERGIRLAGAAVVKLIGQEHPTRLFSPHLVLVAHRKAATPSF